MAYEGDRSQPSIAARAGRIIREDPFVRGCVLFCVFGLLLGLPIVSMLKAEPERSASPMSESSGSDAASALPQGFNTIGAVTLCDSFMREQVVSPSKFRLDAKWRTAVQGQVVAIRRGFQATNVMNEPIRGEYTCLVAAPTGSVIGLQFQDGERKITVPGRALVN